MNVERNEPSQVIINPQVTYNIGDLLDRLGTRLDTGFASLNTKLDEKASKTDLATINATLAAHDGRLGKLEAGQAEEKVVAAALLARKDRARDWRRWALEIAVAAAAAGGTIALVLH